GVLLEPQARSRGDLSLGLQEVAARVLERVRLALQRAQQHDALHVRDAARAGGVGMSETDAVRAIRRAAKRRDRADETRREAVADLRERIRAAQAEGVSVSQIAREAGLSRQGV